MAMEKPVVNESKPARSRNIYVDNPVFSAHPEGVQNQSGAGLYMDLSGQRETKNDQFYMDLQHPDDSKSLKPEKEKGSNQSSTGCRTFIFVVIAVIVVIVIIGAGVGAAVLLKGTTGEISSSSTTVIPTTGTGEISSSSTRDTVETHSCDSNPCKNGGVCIQLQDGFVCDCSDTIIYEGPTCEDGLKPVWASWGSWSNCSATCAGGVQHRLRNCMDPIPTDDQSCVGKSKESRVCNSWSCPDCGRVCDQFGELNDDCDACECDTHVLSGLVTDDDKRPLSHATIATSERPYASLAITDSTGKFIIQGICATPQSMLVTKPMFTTVQQDTVVIDGVTSHLNVSIQRLELPFISDHPRHKMRVYGESVALCCDVDSDLPLKYEWFKDGDIIESSNATSEKLILHRLTAEDTGLYTCRACSEAGCVLSEPGKLNVTSDPHDVCNVTPVSKVIRLPDDCPQSPTNRTEYDVGTCVNTPCDGNELSATMCQELDDEISCCRPNQTEKIIVPCQGYTLPVFKVISCACGECVQPESKIIGKVVSTESNEALNFVGVYYNNTKVTHTNSKGKFEFTTKKQARRLSLTFQDIYFNRVMSTTIVVPLNIGSVHYRLVKMKPHPPPMIIDSAVETFIPLVGNGSNAMAELIIAPNSTYDSNGEPYAGDVSVTVDNIDMRNTTDMDMAPGDFTTVDDGGSLVELRSFGMFSIGLSDSSGNPLSIGGTSQLEIDQAMIPDCQPNEEGVCKTKIWIFNKKTGSWELSSPLVMSKDGGRRKRQSPVYVAGVDVSTINRLYNIDDIAPTDDRCWAKIIAYETQTFDQPLPNTDYEVTSVLNDTRENFLQRNFDRPLSTSKHGTGVCVAQGCDSSPNPDSPRYTSWLSVTSSGKNFLPAKVEEQADYAALDYNITADDYNIRIKPVRKYIGPNGPIYLGKNAGYSTGKCSKADHRNSKHFQFYIEPPPVTCYTAHTARHPGEVKDETFYPKIIGDDLSSQSFCFIRIRISTPLSTVEVVARSSFRIENLAGPETYGTRSVRAKKASADEDHIDVCMEFRCTESDAKAVVTVVDIDIKNGANDLICPIEINSNTPDFKSHLENSGMFPPYSSSKFFFLDPKTYGDNYGLYKPQTSSIIPHEMTCKEDTNSPQNAVPDGDGNCGIHHAILVNCN